MTTLLEHVRALMGSNLDINEHLGLLRGLAMDPDVHQIVEIGFRGGVSAAALASAGKPLLCIDIESCKGAAARLKKMAPNFTFKQADSLEAVIPICGLLHIDSLHTYKQLFDELCRFGSTVQKWIVLHDTETFGEVGKNGKAPGLKAAVKDFMSSYPEWDVFLQLTNNNGLTILYRP